MELAYAAVLDKSGQVFKPAICGSLRVRLSESGFYGSQVRGIRIIGRLGVHQEVIALIKDRKSLILREVVGAKGFEPSTSWSRTRRASQAALRPDIACATRNALARLRVTQETAPKPQFAERCSINPLRIRRF